MQMFFPGVAENIQQYWRKATNKHGVFRWNEKGI